MAPVWMFKLCELESFKVAWKLFKAKSFGVCTRTFDRDPGKKWVWKRDETEEESEHKHACVHVCVYVCMVNLWFRVTASPS